jgi:flagellar biosynthesis protein FlhF
MMMKKFTADSYYEAYLQAQAELGEDVMIIQSRTTSKSAWAGLYSKEYVEITAAVPNARADSGSRPAPARPAPTQEVSAPLDFFPKPSTVPSSLREQSPSSRPLHQGRTSFGESAGSDRSPVYSPPRTLASHTVKTQQMRGSHSIRSNQEGDTEPVSQRVIQEEDHNEEKIKALLDTICRQKSINASPESQARSVSGKPSGLTSSSESPELKAVQDRLNSISKILEQMVNASGLALEKDLCNLPEGIASLKKRLLEIETPEEITRDIISQIMSDCPKKVLHSSFSAFQYAASWLEDSLTFSQEPVLNPDFGPRIFILVGPTGVGKTTTIAKLAASFALNVVQRKSVALFTLDTFRIGAPAQLDQYAQIIEADMEIILEPNDIPDALNRHKKKDVILVDTAGRCQKNAGDLSELKGFLDKFPAAEKFLVLSATTKFSDMLETVKCFKMTGFDHLIFSKVDETNTCGPLLALLHKTNYSLAYITNGQSVPDDFKPADAEFFRTQIFDTIQ